MNWSLPKDVIKRRRRELNAAKFPSEIAFIKLLRERGLHLGFRRNYPLLGRYFGDFVWMRLRLVVEIDGRSHDGKAAYDAARDAELVNKGYTVIRLRYPLQSNAVIAFLGEWETRLAQCRPKAFTRWWEKNKHTPLVTQDSTKPFLSFENRKALDDLQKRRQEFQRQLKARRREDRLRARGARG